MIETKKMPKCSAKSRHRWVRNQTGCKENLGVWGIGGSAIHIGEHCIHCNVSRYKIIGDVNINGNRNCGWRYAEEV